MKVRTNLKAGGVQLNHNETLVRAKGLKVKTHLKAGAGAILIPVTNHNETLVRDAAN